MMLHPAQHGADVLLRMLHLFDADDATENKIGRRIRARGRDHTRAVYEVNTLHEADVLPHFCLPWYRGDVADLLLKQRIDDGRFSRVGTANEAHRYLFPVRMEARKLPQQLDQ